MSSFAISAIGGMALIFLLLLGIPVAYALGIVAAVGIYFINGPIFLFATLETLPYGLASQYTFLVVPMFILMGAICARIGIIAELYDAANKFTARWKGGLYIATIFASAGFAAISGSTVVAASVFSRIAIPEMKKYGYNLGVAGGCVAAAGTLSAMIPPSLAMVLFGILTNESIGALLLAGLLPGLMTAVVYAVSVRGLVAFRPGLAPAVGKGYSWGEKFRSLGPVSYSAILAVLVLGGIYSGVVSPSAAGSLGAAGAILIGLMRRRLGVIAMRESLREALMISASLFLIVIAGLLFSRFLISTGLVRDIAGFLDAASIGKWEFMAIVVITYLLVGLFVDGVSVLVITLPVLYPVSQAIGIDPIWLGVVVVKLIEIAAITPPVGLNLFAVLGSLNGEIRSTELFKGVMPFVLLEFVILALLIAFPVISTWLPGMMLGR